MVELKEGEKVKITFTISAEDYEDLREQANREGTSMASLFRDSLRKQRWLDNVLEDEDRELLIRDKDHPRELRQVVKL